MSILDNFLDKAKTNDLMLGDTIIMLTGNGFLLEQRHGYILETESSYPDDIIYEDHVLHLHEVLLEEDSLFDNYISLSVGFISRLGKFVPRKRDKGFISKSSEGLNNQIDLDIETFEELYRDQLIGSGVRFYNVEGGFTFEDGSGEGSLFDLNSSTKVERLETGVVKRLSVPHDILQELINNKPRTVSFFKNIDEEMKKVGCDYYTFKRVDGGGFLSRYESSKNIEIRAYGMAKEKK